MIGHEYVFRYMFLEMYWIYDLVMLQKHDGVDWLLAAESDKF